jgi:hypothetical protein
MTKAEFILQYTQNIDTRYSNILPIRQKLEDIAAFVWDSVKFRGGKTAAQVAALDAEDLTNGDSYRVITTGGNLNSGGAQITVSVGDTVVWNSASAIWQLHFSENEPYVASLKFQGEKTATQIAAIDDAVNGDVYIASTVGVLNDGETEEFIAQIGDLVVFNGTDEVWEVLVKANNKTPYELVDDDTILTAADHNKVFAIATDAKTFTLPATIAGFECEFINLGAAGDVGFSVSPAAADGIVGTFTLAASVVSVDGTVNKDIINTKATALPGNRVRLFGTGVTGTSAWVVKTATGIFAQEG